MAATANTILKELIPGIDKALEAFRFAPGMDDLTLPEDLWGEVYRALWTVSEGLRTLQALAQLAEERIEKNAPAK